MAKAVTIKIKLLSTADTGFFYVTKKNSRTMTEKMSKKKGSLSKLPKQEVIERLISEIVSKYKNTTLQETP